MDDIRDLNPGDRVDRADRSIVRGLRRVLIALGVAVLLLAAYALVEAGWVAWATIGIVVGAAGAVALIVLLIVFLMS
ncbi:MAG: hypothetical protein JXQ29_07685 [Planctomycetes bacterium]|nr:hypothetical protein [Planctomycetota bacterium]